MRIFADFLLSNLKNLHTLQDKKIMAHHTLQDILKIFMPALAPHVISRGRGCKQNGYCVAATCCRRIFATFRPAVPPTPLSTEPSQLFVVSWSPFQKSRRFSLLVDFGYCGSTDVIIVIIIPI